MACLLCSDLSSGAGRIGGAGSGAGAPPTPFGQGEHSHAWRREPGRAPGTDDNARRYGAGPRRPGTDRTDKPRRPWARLPASYPPTGAEHDVPGRNVLTDHRGAFSRLAPRGRGFRDPDNAALAIPPSASRVGRPGRRLPGDGTPGLTHRGAGHVPRRRRTVRPCHPLPPGDRTGSRPRSAPARGRPVVCRPREPPLRASSADLRRVLTAGPDGNGERDRTARGRAPFERGRGLKTVGPGVGGDHRQVVVFRAGLRRARPPGRRPGRRTAGWRPVSVRLARRGSRTRRGCARVRWTAPSC